MKRVSFEVAKALKDAGYLQTHGMCYYIGVDEFRPMEISRQAYNCNEHISAPTYLDVWLWLWREKKIEIEIFNDGVGLTSQIRLQGRPQFFNKDPEEAIEAAIKYLVDNDLIK